MKRSKQSKKSLAEKALRSAISEETAELNAQLRAVTAENVRLRSVFANISTMAGVNAKVIEATQKAGPPPPLPDVAEPALPQGPKVDLSEDDTQGEGRWV